MSSHASVPLTCNKRLLHISGLHTPRLLPKGAILTRRQLAQQDMWQARSHFWLALWWGVQLASSVQWSGSRLTILECTRQSYPTKNYLPPNIDSVEENSCPEIPMWTFPDNLNSLIKTQIECHLPPWWRFLTGPLNATLNVTELSTSACHTFVVDVFIFLLSVTRMMPLL